MKSVRQKNDRKTFSNKLAVIPLKPFLKKSSKRRQRWPDVRPMLCRRFGGHIRIFRFYPLTKHTFRHFLLADDADVMLDSPVPLVGAEMDSYAVGGAIC